MNRLIVLIAALALLTACSSDAEPPAAKAPTPAAESTAISKPAAPTLRQVVHDPDAVLLSVRVAGTPSHRSVTSAWALGRHRAIVHSDDEFETARFMRWTPHRAQKWMPSGNLRRQSGFFGLDGLLTRAAPEIGRLGLAVIGGGDGATLFPFDKVSRFDGRRWTAYDVKAVRGQRGYTSGGVVLPDGRLLVLLDHWSGDRARTPSAVWHGLWVSAGDDWTSYRPWRPDFRPALTKPEWGSPLDSLGGSSGRRGVLWVTTWDGRTYTSTDGRSFREIRTR